MNYALFLSGNQFGVIPTAMYPGVSERMLKGKCVTLFVAPRSFVDDYLKLDCSQPEYMHTREHLRTQKQMKDAVLSFFYGQTSERTYTCKHNETTKEVILKLKK